MRAIILALWLVSTPAMAAGDQFDLVCTGKYQKSSTSPSKAGERIYRLDLAAKTWCVEDCSVLLPIAAIDNARIILQSYERYGVRVEPYVDRTTGAIFDIDFSGQCEPAAFSGMPVRKF